MSQLRFYYANIAHWSAFVLGGKGWKGGKLTNKGLILDFRWVQ